MNAVNRIVCPLTAQLVDLILPRKWVLWEPRSLAHMDHLMGMQVWERTSSSSRLRETLLVKIFRSCQMLVCNWCNMNGNVIESFRLDCYMSLNAPYSIKVKLRVATLTHCHVNLFTACPWIVSTGTEMDGRVPSTRWLWWIQWSSQSSGRNDTNTNTCRP